MDSSDRLSRKFPIASVVAGLLATAALGYYLGNGAPADDPASAVSVPDRPVGSRLVTEVEGLRGELSDLQNDVAMLRQLLPTPDATSAVSAQPSDKWLRELNALKQELRALQAKTVAMQPVAEKDYLVADAQESVATLNSASDLQDMVAADAEYFGTMDARFMDEVPDPGWSMMAEETVNQTFQSPELADMQLGKIDCRSNLCRFDVWLDDETQELEMLLMPLLSDGFKRMAIEVPQEAGGRRTVYLGRDDRAFDKL